MRRTLPALIAIALMLLTGAVHGFWTGRWVVSHELRDAVARIDGIPETTGDWESRPSQLDARELEVGGIAGHLLRTYVNRKTGQELTAMLVCGRPGPISVHTPDICYAGTGYAQEQEARRLPFAMGGSGGEAEFLTADFLKERSAVPSKLRIFWGWNAGDGWGAPANPRMAYAMAPALFKIYIVRQMGGGELASKGDDPGLEFLREWLPQVDRTLFPGR